MSSRDRSAGNSHGVSGIDLTHLRLDHQIDKAALEHGWGECEPDAVWLVGKRHRAKPVGLGDGELAAGEEARGVTR